MYKTKFEPGGGGINVARALKKLGSQATAIFSSGGYTGKLFNHLLEAENITAVIILSFLAALHFPLVWENG